MLLNFGHLEMPCSKWLDFICRYATAPFLQCIIVTFEQVQLATGSLVLLFHNFLPLLHMRAGMLSLLILFIAAKMSTSNTT